MSNHQTGKPRFMWEYTMRPSRYRSRSGAVPDSGRSKDEWQNALDGHVRDAHGGKVAQGCPACKELQARL